MAGLSLTQGTVLEYRGRRYTCGGRGPGGAYLLAPHVGRSNQFLKPEMVYDELKKGRLKIVQDMSETEAIPYPEAITDLSPLSEIERNDVLKRYFYMRELLKYRESGGTLSNKALDDFAKRTHSSYVAKCRTKGICRPKSAMSATAIRRWYKKWVDSGFNLITLVRDSKGNSHSKLTLEQETMLYDAIHDDYMNTNRHSARLVHSLMRAKINLENRARELRGEPLIPVPHYKTLCNHINRIDLYDNLKARYNAAYAHKVTREYGITPSAKRHLERAQIDHTQLDIYVDFGGKLLFRPWLTLVLDSYSKAIMGFWISPDHPSSESVMQAMRMAIMPKNLPELGGDSDWYWPMYGLMSELLVDNGKEFHSHDLETAAAELNITLNFTPPRQPWFKAQIERKFGEINRSLLSQLPGQVFKYEPEKHGKDYPHLTLNELNRLFLQWITTVLHRKPNKEGYTPEELWLDSLQKHGTPGSELDSNYIHLCLAKTGDERVIHPNGIKFLNLTYNNDWLSRLRNELTPQLGDRKPKVKFKWSAHDIGTIWVIHPKTLQCFPVKSKEQYAHGRSLYNHRVILREQRNRYNAKMGDSSYIDAELALNETVKAFTTSKSLKGKKVSSRAARFTKGSPENPSPRTEPPRLSRRLFG